MEAEKSATSLMSIQEVKWGGQGQVNENEFSFLYSGDDKQGKNGVGFLVTRKLTNKIIDFKPINGRIAYFRIEAKCPRQDTVIMLGDINSQIGKEDFVSNVAEKYTIHERTNDHGHRFCNLAAAKCDDT